jgi:hypothetical protein
MEYPPRKFHPLRKRPELKIFDEPKGKIIDEPKGKVLYWQAKAKGLIRECGRLGIELFGPMENPADFARREAQYNLLEGDLIENIPKPKYKLDRRQNMIHGDLDPSNGLSAHRTLYDAS